MGVIDCPKSVIERPKPVIDHPKGITGRQRGSCDTSEGRRAFETHFFRRFFVIFGNFLKKIGRIFTSTSMARSTVLAPGCVHKDFY